MVAILNCFIYNLSSHYDFGCDNTLMDSNTSICACVRVHACIWVYVCMRASVRVWVHGYVRAFIGACVGVCLL